MKKYISDYDKTDKFLESSKWVADMCDEGKLDQALARTKRFGYAGDSYSRMNQVFDVIDRLKSNALSSHIGYTHETSSTQLQKAIAE